MAGNEQLLANIALSALDRQYQADWQEMSSYHGKRKRLHRKGHPTYRLCRYADDLVLMVMGTRDQANALLEQLSERVEALGLKLKAEKTALTHIDEGFVFLGQKIIGRTKHGKHLVYTFVTNEAIASIKRKVKALTGRSTTNLALSELIAALNPVLRGWVNYYGHAAANRTVRLPGLLRLVAGRALASQEAPADDLEADQPTLPQQRPHLPGRRDHALQAGPHARHALPVPGSAHPDAVDDDSRTDQPANTSREPPGTAAARTHPTGARMNQIPLRVTHGEPDAEKFASPVRRAAVRKPPAARPTSAPRR